MSRIQQILEKAERDGTAQRVEPLPLAQAASVMALEPPAEHQAPFERRIPKDFVARHTVAAQEPFVSLPQEPFVPVPADETAHEPTAAGSTLDRLLVAGLEPLSIAAEQYRALRTRITQAEQGQQAIRVIQVTSPGKQDGKTVTSLNLALTLAQEFQRRVLVIDADLRQPRVHGLLGLEPGPGLVDVVTGSCSLDEAIVEIPEYRLSVLRAGRSHERPAELLGSAAVRRVLDTLRTSFDRIVVDSAPAIVADPGALVPLVDCVLLVVRAGQTTKPSIAAAVSALGTSKLLGMVFNKSRASQPRQYGAGA